MKRLYDRLSNEHKETLKNVKFLGLDFDGVLSDNKVYLSEDGLEINRCCHGDGHGITLVRKLTDVYICIISTQIKRCPKARADKLKIDCTHGVPDAKKIDVFKQELEKRSIDPSQAIFVGNDFSDIKCLELAGFGVAVNDAFEQVKSVANYITKNNGGNNAVREICEFILYAKDKHPYKDGEYLKGDEDESFIS